VTFLRAIWQYSKRVGRALRALVGGVISFIAELLKALFEGPIGAFERLVRKILDLLGWLLEVLRSGWLRIWQKAPSTPTDKRATPGREVLPLLAGTATTAIWYLVPLAKILSWPTWKVCLALPATWLVSFCTFRWACRRDPAGRAESWLIETRHRVGLLWFERLAFLGLSAGAYVCLDKGLASAAPLMLAFGFLVLMASEYEPRPLSDDLPTIDPAAGPEASDKPTTDATDAELRSFHWSMQRATKTDALDITVAIDPDRVAVMASTNPKRPLGGTYPDWTPWVIAGVTPEVTRAAAEIRSLSNRLGLSRFEETAAVLGFAQSVDYSFDVDSTGEDEYWRYPIETMYEQTGDCEDSSILAASVLVELGHQVLPLVTKDHAAIAVAAPIGLPGTYLEHEGQRYYYCETTAKGFRIGELPADMRLNELRVCPLRLPQPDDER